MRRYTDYRVNIIRYNDGISDIAQKIKQKATDLYKQFKQLKSGQKIAYLLSKLIQYMSAIYAGVNLAKLSKLLKATKEVTVEEAIKHATEYKDNSSLLKGETKVITKGADGSENNVRLFLVKQFDYMVGNLDRYIYIGVFFSKAFNYIRQKIAGKA